MEDMKEVILVVDDHPVQLHILLPFLEESGYEVILAEDGERALAILETEPVDLILLDILMPGIDGLETCRRIKVNKDTADISIIFMTGLDNVEDKVAGFKAGCVDYITKPFQHVEVLARVQTHLELRQQKRLLAEMLAEVKKLTGILPICCRCKKIRDDKGYWRQVDDYLSQHVEVEFSHGYCKACFAEEMAGVKAFKGSQESPD